MKFLVIGLGSMGKRRIRCLQNLGETEVFGFDLREDRAKEANERYGVVCFNDFSKAISEVQPDAIIISVPPDQHHIYIDYAITNNTPCFIEASVVDINMQQLINKSKNVQSLVAPSSTMWFHPAIQLIKKIIEDGELGKLSNFTYHSGQYLPDWHVYEKVKDYYVSNPATGGAREIVPFELTWIVKIFGLPCRLAGNVRKTIEIEGAEKIDDTYNCLLDYNDFLMTLTVDVVSRFAVRRLLINGDKKQLVWDWNEKVINLYDPEKESWEKRGYAMGESVNGYNTNIGENMYIDEIKEFIKCIKEKREFVNTLEKDYEVLKLLYNIEEADATSKFVEVGK